MKTPCIRLAFGLGTSPLEALMPRLNALVDRLQDEGVGTRMTRANATVVLELIDYPTGFNPLVYLDGGLHYYRWINLNYSEVERTEE